MVGKGENAGNQHFLLLPPCFLPSLKQTIILQSLLFCHLHNYAISLEFCCLVKIKQEVGWPLNWQKICQQQNVSANACAG